MYLMWVLLCSSQIGLTRQQRSCLLPNCDNHEEDEEGQRYEEQVESALREKRSFYKSGAALGEETSATLDYLLEGSGYNRRVRPQFGITPVQVKVNLAIRSMGPVDDNNEAYSLDCYFRQNWLDNRLKFNTSGLNELALNWAFLTRIWVPDTFIVNGKQSALHKITVPNRFIRIKPNGELSYSSRLTLRATCKMDLRKFPFDTQNCMLRIGSFGYSAMDVVYQWASSPLSMDDDAGEMAQFSLASWTTSHQTQVSNRLARQGFRNDSTIAIHFIFERQTGFFLLQIYTPLILIVVCSWVSFWLVKTEKGGEVPARTALGATTVLSIVNIGFGGKSKPKVSYATALDIYVLICFFSVFAAVIEFAIINFIDIFVKRFKKWEEEEAAKKPSTFFKVEEEKKKAEEETAVEDDSKGLLDVPQETLMETIPNIINANVTAAVTAPAKLDLNAKKSEKRMDVKNELIETATIIAAPTQILTKDECCSTEDEEFEDIDDDEEEEEVEEEENRTSVTLKVHNFFANCCARLGERFFRKYSSSIPNMKIYTSTLDIIYGIDGYSRVLFPIVFFTLNIIYWSAYIYLL